MRLGLTQSLRTEQRMVQSPQMIQAMQILQCPLIELQGQIEQELQENVFLEVSEDVQPAANGATDSDGNRVEVENDERGSLEERLTSQFEHDIDQLEQRTEAIPGTRARGSEEESDRRLEMLNNTPDHGVTLSEHLLEQVREQDVTDALYAVCEHIVFSLDDEGRLSDTAEQLAEDLQAPLQLVEEAIALIRSLDPAGIAANDLRDCLLMQLDRLSYVRPLTRTLVEHHLDDLALNKLPKIAKDTGATIEEIKDSWAFIRDALNPHPGALFRESRNSTVSPDVIVEEVDGEFEVRTERGSLPDLVISASYRNLLREARSDPKVHEYLRKKIESAKWFIEAIHQRQNTIQRIASEIVRRQEQFLRHGVQQLVPMKMQEVADAVGVHISTVSRAISGKYVETPQGIFEIKRFFSGGTVTDSGKMLSQQAVKDQLRRASSTAEDKQAPLSDDQLVEELAKRGVHIADAR
jgi:RNA polymerase sigma-54 factor